MFRMCFPFPLIDALAAGLLLVAGAILLVRRRSRQGSGVVDGNERLMIRVSILAGFSLGVFVIFILAWRPC